MKKIITNLSILAVTILLAVFTQNTVLVSPSHPFVDDNGDGIDDFEQGTGEYADPEIRAKIYGVNFPVADLGNCSNYNECRSFCEDPVNGQGCKDYGKSRGFYKDDPVEVDKDKILNEAKRRLGCDSMESCMNFCEIPANYDKCNSFAKTQGIPGGVVDDPGGREIITKAKEVLGCDSASSCQSFCSQQENIDKCKTFAQDTGLKGGEQRVGPGGCMSEGTCKSFCSDPANYQACSGFTAVAGGKFKGPGGCESEEACKNYCEKTPQACGLQNEGDNTSLSRNYNPAEMCNRTPNCSWSNNSCQCGYYGETKETRQKSEEYSGFCRNNPDKCRPGQNAGLENSEKRAEFEDFCKQNPDKCKPPADAASEQSYGKYGGYYYGGGSADPAAECARYGCAWSNNSCQCTSATVSSGANNPPGGYAPPAGTSQQPGYTGGGADDYCSKYPDRCRGTAPYGGSNTQPAAGSTYTAPAGPGSYTPPTSGGGSYTPPAGGSYTPPAPQTAPTGDSGGSAPQAPSGGDSGGGGGSAPAGGGGGSAPSGDSGGGGGGSAPSVQGTSTANGLLQLLLNFLKK